MFFASFFSSASPSHKAKADQLFQLGIIKIKKIGKMNR
jgi:hypothetical protein